eukprot:TRINITY_DN40311_c0_g1_i7.p1 TRINITY_DN40311_c0_g1~~TRINITY_DN40311_c0_g1_i7.p1  ORF type:complete len:190 (+),score=0.05 TRINITY_DN40311_c0_g1_i7:114-683(+)
MPSPPYVCRVVSVVVPFTMPRSVNNLRQVFPCTRDSEERALWPSAASLLEDSLVHLSPSALYNSAVHGVVRRPPSHGDAGYTSQSCALSEATRLTPLRAYKGADCTDILPVSRQEASGCCEICALVAALCAETYGCRSPMVCWRDRRRFWTGNTAPTSPPSICSCSSTIAAGVAAHCRRALGLPAGAAR